ncbi:fibroblast growth factor receptor-like 1 isoform X2 [Lethenteron reissneri]|uniref:fibroblast growth factor receptor-like 1 isoform X2 n=1 Tax=Lethenteron reissneri TaxID=7753 RepID=UPI002AB771B0|nr:fibroblast growth factor receptor-like 1 isoform X2 [Lethenteron reissneri]
MSHHLHALLLLALCCIRLHAVNAKEEGSTGSSGALRTSVINARTGEDGHLGKAGMKPRFTQPAKMRRRVIARPVGSSVRLKCSAGGSPRPDVVWFKDEHVLGDAGPSPTAASLALDVRAAARGDGDGMPPDLRKAQGKKRWTLILRSLRPEDAGRYTCRVSNRFGEISATYKIDVIERMRSKPVLTGTHPVNTTVDFGGSTSLQCKVRSDVKPVIQWLKRVEPGGVHGLNSTIDVRGQRFAVLPTGEVWSRPDGSYLNKLVIVRARAEDAGMYICLGANSMGYSFRSAFLTVQSDPTKMKREPLPSASALPWPAIVGIPTGVCLLLAMATFWLCRHHNRCRLCRPSSPAGQGAPLPGSPDAQRFHQQALPHLQQLQHHQQQQQQQQQLQYGHINGKRGGERAASAQATLSEKEGSSLAGGPEECALPVAAGIAQTPTQPVVLGAPRTFPPSKFYHMDVHSHYHAHAEGKVQEHQYVHYKC